MTKRERLSSPEAAAYFQDEHDQAVEEVREILTRAFAEDGPFENMRYLEYNTFGALHDDLGKANYELLLALGVHAPMVREFLK